MLKYSNKYLLNSIEIYTIALISAFVFINLVVGYKFILLNILFFICFVFFSMSFILTNISTKIKIHYFIFMIILFLIQIIPILINSNYFSIEYFGQNINIIVSTIYFYITYAIITEKFKWNNKYLYDFLIFFVLVGLFSVAYNIIFHFQDILKIPYIKGGYELNICSFFRGRNHYGFFLFWEIIASMLLILHFKVYKIWYLLFLFYVNLIFTFSRASILAATFFLILIIILSLNKKYFLILFFLGLVICVILIFKQNVLSYVVNYILRIEGGSAGRISRWTRVLNYFKDSNLLLLFGAGNAGSKSALYSIYNSVSASTQTDNTYLDILISGGILKITFYFGIIAYQFKIIISLFRYNKILAKVFFASIISFLLYCNFESIIILEQGLLPWCALLYIIIIPRLLLNWFNESKYDKTLLQFEN